MPARFHFSFSQKLFFSVISLFLVFVACFVAYQYHREKEYKVELLNSRLQDYNDRLHEKLLSSNNYLHQDSLNKYIHSHHLPGLRLTIITPDGKVIYDSKNRHYENFDNHLQRKEVQQALQNREGYDINRTSESTGVPYFYSARYYDHKYILRTALPYDLNLIENLKADVHYIWFTLLITLLLTFFFYQFTRRLGTSISQLQEFAKRADRNEAIEMDLQMSFPHNELGEISQHIIQIYNRLHETKEALYIEHKKLIAQEEEQIRVKRQLTQNIAHELKTPVSSIQGYLETIVNNKDLPKEKMESFFERCYAQSNRLSRLLRDISVLTRMDEAANMIEMEQVNIGIIVKNILEEVSLELEEKNIQIINELPDSVLIQGNASLIYSIFRNLTDNALTYAGTNISIHIKCTSEDDKFYYFSYSDTGIGVASEHLSRLFERFYRVDKGRSRKLGGTGLGLAIVKNAVLIHGGTISAHLNEEGGLKFIFTLKKK